MKTEGIFEVQSGENAYTVDFKTPLCTCPDWIQTNYPCKHFFAVFRTHPSWDWNTLPTTYLESPRLKLDSRAVDDYFGIPQSSTAAGTDLDGLSEKEDQVIVEDYKGVLTKKKVCL